VQKFYLSLTCGVLLLVSCGLQTRLLLTEDEVQSFPLLQLGIFAFGMVALFGYAYVHRPWKKSS
jgi:hypothetical protein